MAVWFSQDKSWNSAFLINSQSDSDVAGSGSHAEEPRPNLLHAVAIIFIIKLSRGFLE